MNPRHRFPEICIDHPSAVKYFQFVSLSDDYALDDVLQSSRRERIFDPHTFLDTIWDLSSPLMKTIYPYFCRGSRFTDEPVWSKDRNLVWRARCYALDRNDRFVLGIGWGFRLLDGRVHLIRPYRLAPSRRFRAYKAFVDRLHRPSRTDSPGSRSRRWSAGDPPRNSPGSPNPVV